MFSQRYYLSLKDTSLRIMGSQNWWFGDPRTLLYRVKPVYRRVQWFLGFTDWHKGNCDTELRFPWNPFGKKSYRRPWKLNGFSKKDVDEINPEGKLKTRVFSGKITPRTVVGIIWRHSCWRSFFVKILKHWNLRSKMTLKQMMMDIHRFLAISPFHSIHNQQISANRKLPPLAAKNTSKKHFKIKHWASLDRITSGVFST